MQANKLGRSKAAKLARTEVVNGWRIRCYDNGGATFDRYTVVYLDIPEADGCYQSIGMSDYPGPFHPQGYGQHGAAMLGKHLGRRVPFASLPLDCQRAVQQDLQEEK